MFPFGGILSQSGVKVTDIVEDHTATGFVRQEITFFRNGTLGEAGYTGVGACSGVSTLYQGEWWRGSPLLNVGDGFEVRVASVSVGAFDIQAAVVGTWIAIDADRCWGMVRTGGPGGEGPGSDQVVAIMEIREKVSQTIRATFNVDLTATKE